MQCRRSFFTEHLCLNVTFSDYNHSFICTGKCKKQSKPGQQASKKKMLLQLPSISETPAAPKNKPTVTYIREDLWKSNNVVSFVVECLVLLEHLQGARKKTASLYENQL